MTQAVEEVRFAIVFENDLPNKRGESIASVWLDSSFPIGQELRGELLLFANLTLRQMANYGIDDPMTEYIDRSMSVMPSLSRHSDGYFAWTSPVVPPGQLLSVAERQRRNLVLSGRVRRAASSYMQDGPRFEGTMTFEDGRITQLCHLVSKPKGFGFLQRRAPRYGHLAVQQLYALLLGEGLLPSNAASGEGEPDWMRLSLIRGTANGCHLVKLRRTAMLHSQTHLAASVVREAFQEVASALESTGAYPHVSDVEPLIKPRGEDVPVNEEWDQDPTAAYKQAMVKGMQFELRDRWTEAYAQYELAHDIANEYESWELAASALTMMGGASLENGQLVVAQTCFEKALQTYWSLGGQQYLADLGARWPCTAHLGLGRVFFALDDHEEAHRSLISALSLAEDLGWEDGARAVRAWLHMTPDPFAENY